MLIPSTQWCERTSEIPDMQALDTAHWHHALENMQATSGIREGLSSLPALALLSMLGSPVDGVFLLLFLLCLSCTSDLSD